MDPLSEQNQPTDQTATTAKIHFTQLSLYVLYSVLEYFLIFLVSPLLIGYIILFNFTYL